MKTKDYKTTTINIGKIILPLIVLINLPFNMEGRITYAYDAAGNRIKREIVINPSKIAPGISSGVNENFYDSIGEKSVTITSNGSGIFQISINNLNAEDTGNVSVYSISGITIMNEVITEGVLNIDISSSPNGIYILSVTINENQTTWKITKK